ncbi:MAG: sigma-54 dependent transcriptional regulator [Oscillospiraceae bacterium]|jgi:DNA-binding NtrC family response regulator
MRKLSILLIDDEENQLRSLKSFLSKRNLEIYTAANGLKGFEIVKNNPVDIVITDYRMPEWDGLKTLQMIKEFNPGIDVIISTAFGKVEDAVAIMKSGAYDYLTKPIDLDELENLINRIKEKRLLKEENELLKEQLYEKFKFDSIISQNPKMEEVVNLAGRVAKSSSTIMIRGESGTGKELIARAIHFASERSKKPFITINVASLSGNLLESELFGHEKGSYTGAINQRIGRFEEADNGTLFIDEVGDIPLTVQVKLLRAIQFGEIQKIGSNETIKVNVRILTATHRNLEDMIKENLFREDLYYRLNVITLNLPPLRDRKSDIPVLADHFIRKHSEKNGKQVAAITPEALDILMKYSFPGNVRELENIIERAVVLTRVNKITETDLPSQIGSIKNITTFDPHNLEAGFEEKVRNFEKAMVAEALERSGGNKSGAARLLNISERHIRSIIERLSI